MKILIIGSGGREHALADIYSKSKRVKKVFVAPGNDLMTYQNDKIEIFGNISASDFEALLELAKSEKVDLIDVAQDDPLALGFVNKFQNDGFYVFGPTQKAAEIEWNKDWSRNFMEKYNLPIPLFKTFNNQKEACLYINKLPSQVLYIKASGLAQGKGAIRAENKEDAINAVLEMKQFGKAGETFLIEECLMGEEFSFFALCDEKSYQIIQTAQDHKTVNNCDLGLNTGGMGCNSPVNLITSKVISKVKKEILNPFIKGMEKEGRPYKGILYLGGILNKKGVKIIEFNARWGDPEAEVILPGIKNDYLKLIESVISKKNNEKIKMDSKVRVSVAGCALGYPSNYSSIKGKKIYGLEKVMNIKGIKVYGSGIKKQGKNYVVNGGRIFHLVAEGKDIIDARRLAYDAMSEIFIEDNKLHFRTDIGWKELKRKYDSNN